jgi:hypothetical protein
LLELIVALALMLAILTGLFTLLAPTSGIFMTQTEAADMQQRLRIGAAALTADLSLAGHGMAWGPLSGPLAGYMAPVLPYRLGPRRADPPGSFRSDTITLISVVPGAAQTTIRAEAPPWASTLAANVEPACPQARAGTFCGFSAGTTALLYDATGGFDVVSIDVVNDAVLAIRPRAPSLSKAYAAGSALAEVSLRTYTLRSDDDTGVPQLVSYDGGADADVPVVDHVVGLEFEYYGDPHPPQIRRPAVGHEADQAPVTTYGPPPPPTGVRTTAYPAGENCTFQSGGVPRLVSKAHGGNLALVRLTEEALSDGPWCPDELSPQRFDADLLRIRKVAVRIRVQAAVATLRGPSSVLFAKGGVSSDGSRYLPDREVRFEVAPRNLGMGR